MYIHVNLKQVVIDVTDDCVYVGKNETTGKKVIVRKKEKALGVLSSENEIRPLVAKSLSDDFYNVLDVIPCNIIPEDYEPGKYTYADGKFTEYEGTVPATTKELTVRVELNEGDISDAREGLMETSESAETNAGEIADLRTAIIELEEEIASVSE